MPCPGVRGVSFGPTAVKNNVLWKAEKGACIAFPSRSTAALNITIAGQAAPVPSVWQALGMVTIFLTPDSAQPADSAAITARTNAVLWLIMPDVILSPAPSL